MPGHTYTSIVYCTVLIGKPMYECMYVPQEVKIKLFVLTCVYN